MDNGTIAAIALLLEAGLGLGDYARHRRGCEERQGLGRPCDCGLEAARATFSSRTAALRAALGIDTASIRS